MTKIAFIVNSLRGNNIGRSYPFIKAFSKNTNFELAVFGFSRKNSYFSLLYDLKKDGVRIIPYTKFIRIKNILKQYDIIHVFKPLKHYYQVIKSNIDRPIIIDIDDWELGLYLNYLKLNFNSFKSFVPRFTTIKKFIEFQEYDSMVKFFANKIIVNSTFLKKMYGGDVIYTGIDGKFFDPRLDNIVDKKEIFGNHSIVLGFVGNPTNYKGMDVLMESFKLLRKKYNNIYLVIAGLRKNNKFYKKFVDMKNTVVATELDLYEYRKYLSFIDIFLIPQQFTLVTQAQTPAKLFLAMSMGKAIVATDIGDIKYILGGSGIVVKNNSELLINIEMLIQNKKLRETYGKKSRRRFVENYDLKTFSEKMRDIYKKLL